jgi:hypothetical protein
MVLTSKPVRVGKATYLRVPKECEDLLGLMPARICTVDFQISEKGCSIVYKFAKPITDFIEEATRGPLWLQEKEILA